MNLDKMTIKLRQAIADADMLANEHGNAEITTEHLILALLDQKDGLAASTSRTAGRTAQTGERED